MNIKFYLRYKQIKLLRNKKKIGKELIELAKEIGYQDNDFFGVIGCLSNEKEGELMRNIMFPYPMLE